MRRAALQPGQPRRHTASMDNGPHVPLEVFYVVRTTGEAIGKRHHQICPPLYETPSQAELELRHLRAEPSSSGTYSVWKGTTYIEPAEWLYDVVIADGSVIHASDLPRKST